MKLKVFSVFDVKAKSFITPFFFPEMGMAVRVFKQCVNDPTHSFGKNPEDYSLFFLGEVDIASGTLQPRDKGPEVIGQALQYVEVQE